MVNPYVLAAVHHDAITASRYGRPTTTRRLCPDSVQKFFDAMSINRGNNRARVCTAIAHKMTVAEITDAIDRLTNDQNRSANCLASLNAPDIIVTNERKKHAQAIRLLERVRTKKGG